MGNENLGDIMSRARTGNYQRTGSLADADCVIGLAFGCRSDNSHGLSNIDLAAFAAMSCPTLPKIFQYEIADAHPDHFGVVFRIETHRTAGQYLNSREVAEQALHVMGLNGWTSPALVAHPYHMPRAAAICAKLGMNTIAPDGLHVVRFDRHSAQDWTRDPEAWGAHEDVAIPADHARGWI
jgi:hypothetical protein